MSILIKNATIVYPGHNLHKSKRDILIKNGIIEKIAARISSKNSKIIESPQLHLSPGWMDIGAFCGEPGYEHRESLETLTKTAASGGYTALATFPNTNPITESKSGIQYILNITNSHLVNYYPIGALSKGCNGEEITEMIDMHSNGAIAFSDGLKSIDSSGLMIRALDYVKSVGSLVIHHPQDNTLAYGNLVHEGEVSTRLGMKGNPSLSEILILDRDIELNKYTHSQLLVHNISTKESVSRLKGLSKSGIYSSVGYLNLCKTAKDVSTFDSNKKTVPPLRAEEDRQALISGINKSIIQVISSNHIPLEEESKKLEYSYAKPGATGLQTCYSGLMTDAPELNIERLVKCLAINPRTILSIKHPELKAGAEAELCLFDPSLSWTLSDKTNTSKSKNSPYWNQELKGMVLGVVNGKKQHWNNY